MGILTHARDDLIWCNENVAELYQVELSDHAFFVDLMRGTNHSFTKPNRIQLKLEPFFRLLNSFSVILVQFRQGDVVATCIYRVAATGRWVCRAAANGGSNGPHRTPLVESAIEAVRL
jgi:hypothetical protein